MINDLGFIVQWWLVLFIISIVFFPLTSLIFSSFFEKGYLFSKVIGIALLSYSVLLLGILHILPFTFITIITILIISFIINYFFLLKKDRIQFLLKYKKAIIIEEVVFLLGIIFWSFIRGHEPSIHSLEKFMDFGFINSALRSEYFPPKDMWFPPLTINYYYFGHLTTAVITKLSLLPSYISYNIMLATLFSFTLLQSFLIGANLFADKLTKNSFLSGTLAGILVALSGNLHTIYTLFLPYQNEKPVPLWELAFSPQTFPNSYWYANATRFIPFTIHEFPIYSFVVADLHGHVLDIPFVLLTIGILLSFYKSKAIRIPILLLLSFVLAIMYMTNAWDGIIYFLLSISVISVVIYKDLKLTFSFKKLKQLLFTFAPPFIRVVIIMGIGFFLFTLPFNYFFDPFVSGIGVVCAPSFLTKIGKLGPFLFEADHCQRSPWWQLLMLYGFFYSLIYAFLIVLIVKAKKLIKKETPFVLILILLSTLLILIPEFFYAKDIYPAHYRANTMFKLVYQSFIMLSLTSAYIIVFLKNSLKKIIILPPLLLLLLGVLSYPYFAIQSYYQVPPPSIPITCNPNNPICSIDIMKKSLIKSFEDYKGLDGLAYLKTSYPDDYEAIMWMNNTIKGQPVIVEAQGDSYTDYERISANTGLPTILGWTVHEWLWRKTYDVPAPRIQEVKDIYESSDLQKVKNILKRYNASYIVVGNLERQKYPLLTESVFEQLGKVVFKKGTIKIYKLSL